METESVRWTFGPRESWLSRVATYAPYGLFGGVGLLLVISGVTLVALGAFDASALAVALILALVGGPMSLLYLLFLVRYGSNGSKWFDRYTGPARLTKRGVAIAAVVGATLIVVSVAVAAELLAVLFAGLLVSLVVVSPLATDVELEIAERRLTLGDDDRFGGAVVVEFENVRSAWRLSLGPLSPWRVVVLRRVQGPPLFVPVPDRHVEPFDRALESGRRLPPTAEPKTAGTTRPMRIALAAIGTGFVVTAVGFTALVLRSGETGGGRAFYPVVLLALFGAISLGYAGYESRLARRGGSRRTGDDGVPSEGRR